MRKNAENDASDTEHALLVISAHMSPPLKTTLDLLDQSHHLSYAAAATCRLFCLPHSLRRCPVLYAGLPRHAISNAIDALHVYSMPRKASRCRRYHYHAMLSRLPAYYHPPAAAAIIAPPAADSAS